jgi:Tfp pilus assembly protein PilV
MIALVILGVALLGLSGILIGTSKWQDRVDSDMELTTLAEAKLERLRNYAVARTADTLQLKTGGSLTTSITNHADTVATLDGVDYVRRWKVEDGPATRARQVTIRITPTDTTGRTILSRDFTTIILLD